MQASRATHFKQGARKRSWSSVLMSNRSSKNEVRKIMKKWALSLDGVLIILSPHHYLTLVYIPFLSILTTFFAFYSSSPFLFLFFITSLSLFYAKSLCLNLLDVWMSVSWRSLNDRSSCKRIVMKGVVGSNWNEERKREMFDTIKEGFVWTTSPSNYGFFTK